MPQTNSFNVSFYPITWAWLISITLMTVLYLTSQPNIIKASGLIACAILVGLKRLEHGISRNVSGTLYAMHIYQSKGGETHFSE